MTQALYAHMKNKKIKIKKKKKRNMIFKCEENGKKTKVLSGRLI
jgi:hypothetical protein